MPAAIEADAVAFLGGLPHAYIALCSIDPEVGDPRGITRPAGSPDLGVFIRENHGRRNLYFGVNEPFPGAPDKRLGKANIARLWGVCADLDFDGSDVVAAAASREKRDKQLREIQLAPSITIATGGGYGLFWLLPEAMDATNQNVAELEAQGRGLATLLDGDAVQNVDRIMRLPGTPNLPDARKRARGRVVAPAVLISADGPRHELADVARLAPPQASSAKTEDPDAVPIDMGLVYGTTHFLELPLDLRLRSQALEAKQPFLEKMMAGKFGDVPMLADRSKSGQLFGFAAFLRAGGFTATEYAQLAWVWPHAYAQDWPSETDQSSVRRQLQRAWARCADVLSPYAARSSATDDFDPIPELAKPNRFRLEAFSRIQPDLARRDLIKGVMIRVATVGIIGAPGSGKSQIEAHMGVAIAAGLTWCGHRVLQGAVVCALGEGVEGFRGRVQAIRDIKQLGDIPFFIVPAVPNLLDKADVEAFVDICRQAAAGCGDPMRAVFVDTLTTATPGMDQNSTEGMSRVVSALRFISRELDCAAIAIHHVGKDVSKGARGSSVFNGDLDTELLVQNTGANTFTVKQSKQRDFEKGAPFRFSQLSTVIGKDADGDDVTAVYAEHDVRSAADDFDIEVGAPPLLDPQKACVLEILKEAGATWMPKPDLQARFIEAWRARTPDVKVNSCKASFRKVLRFLEAQSFVTSRIDGEMTEYRA